MNLTGFVALCSPSYFIFFRVSLLLDLTGWQFITTCYKFGFVSDNRERVMMKIKLKFSWWWWWWWWCGGELIVENSPLKNHVSSRGHDLFHFVCNSSFSLSPCIFIIRFKHLLVGQATIRRLLMYSRWSNLPNMCHAFILTLPNHGYMVKWA